VEDSNLQAVDNLPGRDRPRNESSLSTCRNVGSPVPRGAGWKRKTTSWVRRNSPVSYIRLSPPDRVVQFATAGPSSEASTGFAGPGTCRLILEDNGYQEVTVPRAGDIVVFP